MATFSGSPLSYVHYTDSLQFVGSEDTKYTICISDNSSSVASFTRDFLTLPIYYKNVECRVDQKKIEQKAPEGSDPCSYFLVNDSLFMLNMSDRPIVNWEEWVPRESKYSKAFFISALRYSTDFIFDECPIPVFPLPARTGNHVDKYYVEYCHSLNREKDIRVFFSGRKTVREARKNASKMILKNFPDSGINVLEYTKKALGSREYADLMSRSKIAWCPRSVWSPPERECNLPTGKEFEAMCLEIMVIKHSIGTIEPEKRIPGIHFVEMKNNSSDLIEKIKYYLEHDDERKEIAHNGRLWWERNCSTIARANFMLNSCFRAVGHPCL